MNFVKKIFEDNIDSEVHQQFIRFGKGDYKGRFRLGFWKTKKIKIKTSFEFANDLVLLCSRFGDCKVSGMVLSKKNISDLMNENNIEGNSETKKGGLYYQNDISEQELKREQLIELEKESYSTLLDIEGNGFKLKVKKKLPKPGKSEEKIDDRFCVLETDEKFYSEIKKDLFWDMPESKKIDIRHEVIIDEIVMPEGEKDFSKIRELAKRKGKIIRKAEIDGKEVLSEKEFEV
jgi:hypothetical protein|tara:strand:+ start:467 stop:1165 length:699 start_codon:yes stop_codon:yes gene_type:complete